MNFADALNIISGTGSRLRIQPAIFAPFDGAGGATAEASGIEDVVMVMSSFQVIECKRIERHPASAFLT